MSVQEAIWMVSFKDLQVLMRLINVNETPNGRIDGSMSLLLDDTERETVMVTDDRHLKGDENSWISSMTLMSFVHKS